MIEMTSNTAQKHAHDVARLWQLTQETADKHKRYYGALRCRQGLERSLLKVVGVGQHTVSHEDHNYQVKVSEGTCDVSVDDYNKNLQERNLCSSCKTAAQEAFKAKRRTKTDIKVVDREPRDVHTPSCSGESRPSKRQRCCTGTYTCCIATPANVSC